MNKIGLDDFEEEQIKNCQQVSKEDFEKFKIETLNREMNISKDDKYILTKVLNEMNAYVQNRKRLADKTGGKE